MLETEKASNVKQSKEIMISKVSGEQEESPTPTKMRRTGRLKASTVETSTERTDVTAP